MGEYSPMERLQPFLLERITDREPDKQLEGRDKRVASLAEFRRALLQDLQWLLNTSCRPANDEINEYPAVAKSVLNFGIPELAGTTSATVKPETIERLVRAAIQHYEPRVLRHTLEVGTVESLEHSGANIVQIEIHGEAWNVPMPESLFIKTELDLETGQCKLKDQLHSS